MSAFMVGKPHIDGLIQVCLEGPRDTRWQLPFYTFHNGEAVHLNETTADAIGGNLWIENLLSVNHRYPDTIEHPNLLPGPVGLMDDDIHEYTYQRPKRRMNIIEAFKAIDCLEYQSCEHSGWKDSMAAALLETLRRRLIACLPGYSDADGWEWTGQPKATDLPLTRTRP